MSISHTNISLFVVFPANLMEFKAFCYQIEVFVPILCIFVGIVCTIVALSTKMRQFLSISHINISLFVMFPSNLVEFPDFSTNLRFLQCLYSRCCLYTLAYSTHLGESCTHNSGNIYINEVIYVHFPHKYQSLCGVSCKFGGISRFFHHIEAFVVPTQQVSDY